MTRTHEQPTPIRVLVCGGRDYQDQQAVWDALDALRPVAVIIHGGATGADRLAARWAAYRGVQAQAFKPAWDQYGRRAGPIRNGYMLEVGKPDVVVAFPGGSGTADMVRQATAAGVEVMRPTTPP